MTSESHQLKSYQFADEILQMYDAFMSKQDDCAAATKKDIHGLMEMMGSVLQEVHNNREEIKIVRKELSIKIDDVQHDLSLAVEIIKAEAVGANNDRLVQHSEAISKLHTRVTMLEHQAA